MIISIKVNENEDGHCIFLEDLEITLRKLFLPRMEELRK